MLIRWRGTQRFVARHSSSSSEHSNGSVTQQKNGSVTQHTSGQAENLKNAIDLNPRVDLKHNGKQKIHYLVCKQLDKHSILQANWNSTHCCLVFTQTQERNEEGKGEQFPGRRVATGASNHCGERRMAAGSPKSPNDVTSQVLSSVQYICFRNTSVSNMGAPNLLLAPGAINLTSLRPSSNQTDFQNREQLECADQQVLLCSKHKVGKHKAYLQKAPFSRLIKQWIFYNKFTNYS